MSGRAGGLLLLPFALMAAPTLAPALIGGAVVLGVVSAISSSARRSSRNRRHLDNMRQIANERRAAQMSQNYEDQRDAEIRRMNMDAQRNAEIQRQNEIRRQNAEMQRNAEIQRRNDELRRQYAARTGAVSQNMYSVRNEMNAQIDEQARLNGQASEQMMQELENSRRRTAGLAQSIDPAQFADYVNELRSSSKELTGKMQAIQDGFVKNYHAKIGESMDRITKTVDMQTDKQLNELRQLQNDMQAKNAKASQLASEYIAEAEELIASLEKDYEGERFSAPQLAVLRRELGDAARQNDLGNYEAAIAAAKDTALSTMEEIFKTDCKIQEWDSAYNTALTLSAELVAFLEAQTVITEEIRKQAEEKSGKPIEEEIVGLKISDYTDKRPDGMTQFDYLLSKAKEIHSLLDSDKAYDLETRELKSYIDLIGGKLYPSAAETIYKGILNMNNAFSRQNISEELIDFFEEHNFTFKGYSYDEDKHDGALHIGLTNEDSGEEIVVTLAPELVNGEVQTKVDIDQLMGDEANEERKEFYRRSIESVVCENTPGAKISLECDKSYRNRLSDNTGLRDKLKQ